ncbi:hypothetical protein SPLC1_S511200 [Arthrospira platensis C1]|nr:hypothetical protein SPLC1_S511200 [Arthrospira platensis C1]
MRTVGVDAAGHSDRIVSDSIIFIVPQFFHFGGTIFSRSQMISISTRVFKNSPHPDNSRPLSLSPTSFYHQGS